MERVWIGVGSNLLNPKRQVDCAIEALSTIPSTKLVINSSYYRSLPLGMKNQPDFLNMVVILETNLEPELLLTYLQKIEIQQGRVRQSVDYWTSRTLDLDILLFGRFTINTVKLIIPHYDIKNRDFFIYPLIELDNNLILPDGNMIKEIVKNLPRTKLSFWKD